MSRKSEQWPGPARGEGASVGNWRDAERLRREAFLQRTPAQRLRWLQEALEIAYSAGALELPGGVVPAEEPVSSD